MKPKISNHNRSTFLRPIEGEWSFIHERHFSAPYSLSLFLPIAANIWRSPIGTEVLSQSNTLYTIALFFPLYLTVVYIFCYALVRFIYLALRKEHLIWLPLREGSPICGFVMNIKMILLWNCSIGPIFPLVSQRFPSLKGSLSLSSSELETSGFAAA